MTAPELTQLWLDTREPPPDKVAKLKKDWTDRNGKKQSFSVDYMGHADVTDELLKHDPEWNWEPVAWDANGLPLLVRDANGFPRGLWIRLTVHGHSRLGFGSVESAKSEAVKELIGDAIRNAGMRFGIALALWSKAEWEEMHHEAAQDAQGPSQPAPVVSPPPGVTGPTVATGANNAVTERLVVPERTNLLQVISTLTGPSAKAWNEYRKTNRYPPDLVGLTPGQYEAVAAFLIALG